MWGEILQDFSDVSGSAPHYAGSWEVAGDVVGSNLPVASFAQGTGVYDIQGAGVLDDAESFVEFHFPTPLDLGGQPALEVSAAGLSGNAATSFEVRLFDAAGRSAFANFATAEFPAGDLSSATALLVEHSDFDGSMVETLRISGGMLAGEAAFAMRFDAISTSAGAFHDADFNRDGTIDLSELLRVIEIYNTRFGTRRTGAYRVSDSSTDGFETAADIDDGVPHAPGRFHSADYGRDGRLSLSELLRVIELYNFREGTSRVGAYRVDPDTVDGFRPGRRD